MVESNPLDINTVAKTREQKKIAAQWNQSATMAAEEQDLATLSRNLSKMAGRHRRSTVESSVDVLFAVALSKMTSDSDKAIVQNLRKHVAQVEEDLYRPNPRHMDAFFFPNQDNVHKLKRYILKAQRSLLICVFNLTNDILANAIKEVKDRGNVDVRIITDDECMTNRGNDCQELCDYGIPVRTDSSEQYHMHNKYMIVDGEFLLTGSFNWTFQAGANNQENLLVVDHPYYIEQYTKEFERLWTQFAPNEVQAQERAAKTIQKAYRKKQQNNHQRGGQGGGRPAKSQSGKFQAAPGFKFQGW